jgi:hypothetical protein
MVTGFSEADALATFARQRRRQSRAKLASRLGMRRVDALDMVPFDEVVAALGRRAERDAGVQTIPLDSIVGTVSRRPDDFDREFRPRSRRLRNRWVSVSVARQRGKAMHPIDVYRIGDMHFVRDGHHRVSVARASGDVAIDAHVRQVQTKRRI